MSSKLRSSIADQRLHRQFLSSRKLDSPEGVVSRFGAMQSQEFLGAKWSLGLRVRGATSDTIERAFDEGKVLRTHVLRPTWHFVDPKDIRWLVKLTRPWVNASNAYMHRTVKLDEKVFLQSNGVIARALEGRRYLTREELADELQTVGIRAKGIRLVYLVMRAELDSIICSGPRRGKKFTYALLDDRSPNGRNLEKIDALTELATRYFSIHGPATVQDFSWWSGLTKNDAKESLLKASSNLESKEIDGRTYWYQDSDQLPIEGDSDSAILLPTFDEFFVGYASFDLSRRGGTRGKTLVFNSPMLIGGRASGSWRRILKKEVVEIEIAPFAKLEAKEKEAVFRAAERLGQFLGLTVSCFIISRP